MSICRIGDSFILPEKSAVRKHNLAHAKKAGTCGPQPWAMLFDIWLVPDWRPF